jgi:hypothetical protein
MCILLGWGRRDYGQNSEMQQFLLYVHQRRANLNWKVTVGEPIARLGDVRSVSKSCSKVGFCTIYAAYWISTAINFVMLV